MVFLLFIVIFIEGYVVLATELIAIRLIVPWVGSGTEIISIVIAAVLMPLAFGYYTGGEYRKRACSIRNKLLSNFKISAIILTFGLSYVVLDVFFVGLYNLGVVNRFVQTVLYVSCFIVYPVFLLGQTIPLVSNYFSRGSISEITGKILMVSTLGSFCGSIISTVVLMSVIGVHYTVVVVIVFLCLLIVLINKRVNYKTLLPVLIIVLLVFTLNSDLQMKRMHIVNNNSYNTVQILPLEGKKDTSIMALNRNYSSGYREGTGSVSKYIQYINKSFIAPLGPPLTKKSILVIGSAGFTIGLNDTYNKYTFIDVDPDLKKIAENDFLQSKLSNNKEFIAIAARGFLTHSLQTDKKFDLIVLDTFKAGSSIPEHLLTKEYFEQVKEALAPRGFVVINTVAAANFKGRFSKRLDSTIRSVFPYITRVAMAGFEGDIYNAWAPYKNRQGNYSTNVVYSYYNEPDIDKEITIYTDNKNTSFMDK